MLLPDDARAQAHLHIETCAACRQLVIELARDGDLDGIACPDERPPDSLFIGALRTVVNTGSPRDRSGLATQIGQYEIIRLLGRGGMGEVHLARDLRLGRLAAVKLLATRNPDLEVRFLAEARATARCHHENIVVIHEVGTHMGRPYMVLEYLEGQTLRHWLSDHAATAGRPARVPPARAVELMLPVVRALAYAHDQGIVHRDLKPENVMLTRSRRHEGPPFAGLAAFQEADAGRFFGRDRDIERVVAELRSRPLVAVVGPSGAGKSSLVRAGVIPALKRSGEGWDTHIVRPGREPLAALAVLARLDGAHDGSAGTAAGDGADRTLPHLRAEPGYLGARLRALATREIGGVAGALATHAGTVLAGCPQSSRRWRAM